MMGKTKRQSSQQRVEVVYGEQLPVWYARLTALAFFMGMALVIARATTLETLRESYPVGLGVALPPRTLGPAGSLVLDMLSCVPAMLVLLRRVLDRSYVLRSTISHALLGALALWAVVSTAWAADKFAAGVTAAHFFSAGVLLWAMTQLVRSWLRLRWVAAACAGLLRGAPANR
jgi:hypothetical protein